MSIQLNTTTDAYQQIAVGATGGAPSPNTQQYFRTNTQADTASFTVCIWWRQLAVLADGEYTLYDFSDGTNSTHCFSVVVSGTSLTFTWRVSGTIVNSHAVTGNIAGGIYHAFCSFREDGTFALSDTMVVVSVRGGAVTASDAVVGIHAISVGVTTFCSYGKHRFNSTGSAPGVAILVLRSDVIRATEATAIAAIDYPIEAIEYNLNAPMALQLVLNHGGQSKPFGGSDNRNGAPMTTSSLLRMDRNASAFAGHYGTCAVSSTVVGSPTNVGPLDLASFTPRLFDRVRVDAAAGMDIPSVVIGTAPFGTLGPKTDILARSIRSGVWTTRPRVGLVANSRGIYIGAAAEVMTVAGTLTGITAPCNYTDAGWLGVCEPINVVGRANVPPPTGFVSVTTGTAESAQVLEPNYGFDCGVGYPRVVDSGDTLSTMATATFRVSDGTLSTFWIGGRSGSPFPITSSPWMGGSSPRGIKPGFKYRLLLRPHGAFATGAIRFKLSFLNFPTSARPHLMSGSWPQVKRKVAASTQDGAETFTSTMIPLDAAGSNGPWITVSGAWGTGHAAMAITAVNGPAAAWTVTNAGKVNTKYSITVDDSGNTLSSYVVGDMIELTDAAGAAWTANDPNVSIIESISGKGTATCLIEIDRPFRIVPTTSMFIRCMDARRAIITGHVSFTAAESIGSWRGFEIQSDTVRTTGGPTNVTGLVLAAVDVERTDTFGIIPLTMGWNGTGYNDQVERCHASVVHATDFKSHFRRVIEAIAPDVVFLSTGDQHMSGVHYWHRFMEYAGNLDRTLASVEVVMACGAQYSTTDTGATPDYRASNNVANMHAAMEFTARAIHVPMVAWAFDQTRGLNNRARYLQGTDCGEADAHDSGVRTVQVWADQLFTLATAASGGGRTSMGLGM